MKTRRLFNDKMHNWLLNNAQEYNSKELLEIVNKKFKENFTLKQLQQYCSHYKIKYKLRFKNKSHSNKPTEIGTNVIKTDGMIKIKVGDKKWVYKQRKIYEDYYGIKLKDDEYVIFLDQNRTNFDIDNLRKISRRESACLASSGLAFKDKKLTEVGLGVVKLRLKINEMDLQ